MVNEKQGKVPFDQVAAAWLASNPTKRPNTYAVDELVIRVHLTSLASRFINSIRQPDIQALVTRWAKTAKPRTVRRRYGVLTAILSYAVSQDWLARSPCRDIHLPSVYPTQRRLPSPDELEAIVGATDQRYRAFVWAGVALGLRWEETAGLRVRSLDLLAKRVTISETVIRGRHGHPVVSKPKSPASYRTLEIPVEMVEVFSQHLTNLGLTAADRDAWVFPAPDGGPLSYQNFRRRVWLPALKKAGCESFGFHDLRRASATALVLKNVDVKTAGTRLGHSDPRLTVALYAQASKEADRAAADMLGEHFLRGRRTWNARIPFPDDTSSQS